MVPDLMESDAMAANLLSDAAIRALKPKDGHYDVNDGRGLALRIHPTGRKVWMLRATNGRTGERLRRELGEYGTGPGELGLSSARSKADDWRARIEAGTDPTKPAGELTVKAALDAWLKDAGLRSEAMVRRRFELHILPKLGKRLVADVEQKDVARLLRDLRHEKKLQAEANRVRSSLSALFTWAIEQGEVKWNPVAGTARILERSAAREQAGETRVLTLDELAAIWQAAEAEGSAIVSALVRLLILVPLRRQEWTEATWGEIEQKADAWTFRLPASRMKGKRPHAVPLPAAAVAILEAMPRRGAFIFTTDGTKSFAGWRNAADRLRVAVGLPHWYPHDIRRGVATAMGEAGIRENTIRRILAHSPRSMLGVTAVYEKSERLDEMRLALEQWQTTLKAKLTGGAEVVAFRRSAT
jgi:integrase